MEETLYDTSALIEIYRQGKVPKGCTTILNLVEFPKAMDFNLKVLYPSRTDSNLALEISLELLKIGKPLPAVDVIIAAVALNNNLKLITKDRHFESVREVRRDLRLSVVNESIQ
ncbi:PIN domain-containing protein [Candidatus Pyrohabitans sp.]